LAVLSKKLATIVLDMPMNFDINNFTICQDRDQLEQLFTDLEFKSLLARVKIQQTVTPVEKQEMAPAVIYTTLNDVKKITETIRQQELLEFYPVILGRVPVLAVSGIAIAYNGTAVYIPQKSEAWQEVEILLADEKIRKVTHDAKSLYNLCRILSLTLNRVAFDTMLAAYLLEPTATHYSLELLQKQYIGVQSNMQAVDQHTPEYAVWAAMLIHTIYPVLSENLKATGLIRLYEEIEIPLLEVLSSMETAGIAVNREGLQVMSEQLTIRIENLLSDIYSFAAEKFNVNSPKQLGVILFEKLKLPVIKKTKTEPQKARSCKRIHLLNSRKRVEKASHGFSHTPNKILPM
jgi:DNA polymerase-1